MICKHCKTEIEPPGFASNWPLHTDAHCRDVLQADLEYALSELEGCRTLAKGLYDAHATIDKLTAENTRLRLASLFPVDACRQARETRAKLASAVEGLVKICYRGDVEGGEPNDYNEACDWWHECDDAAHAALRALGIDPSKEQGK